MGRTSEVVIDVEDALSSEGSFASTVGGQCCAGAGDKLAEDDEQVAKAKEVAATERESLKKSPSELSAGNNYATSKNVAEGLMDIALLSANANQLRFLITYNHEASTFYCSLVLVILSLVLQVLVGIVLTFKRRLKHCQSRWYIRTNEILVMGVFLITVINVLLAAFTTTDGHSN
ncbi:ninjurin-B [Drosophila grimshawi]|uniref:ninjurin-B n=1 Tax=Drosophila grimshawi TaxID=7222 RepID=UPI001C93346C|nr:ninjurin-B [Drosophila grimshawi]